MQLVLEECGGDLNLTVQDGVEDNFVGIVSEGGSLRLIYLTEDKDSEHQYGFDFSHLVLKPEYILIYAQTIEMPLEKKTDDEEIKIYPSDKGKGIYTQHIKVNNAKLFQIATKYYCNKGLVAVISPKGVIDSHDPESFFE